MKKKDLQKEIDDLRKRVTDLENKPLPYTFTYIPQQPLPFIPTYNPQPLYGGTNSSESTQQERFGAR